MLQTTGGCPYYFLYGGFLDQGPLSGEGSPFLPLRIHRFIFLERHGRGVFASIVLEIT